MCTSIDPRMHHALEIPEILLAIFRAYPGCHTRDAPIGLARLARTCRAFKEPALDILWEELDDLSPLVRCLPEASHRLCPRKVYHFHRPLTDTEWNILRSYTRRIRSIVFVSPHLNRVSLVVLSNPPNPESKPLFPNLHRLRCRDTTEAIPLSYYPLPSLLSLEVHFKEGPMSQKYLGTLPDFSPNIKNLVITSSTYSRIDPNYFCRWKHLQIVCCYRITLDESNLVHLSQMPMLIRLTFTLNATLRTLDFRLSFFNLDYLSLVSESLALVTSFLSHTQLPAITSFAASIRSPPSARDIFSLLACLQTSDATHTLNNLYLTPMWNTVINRDFDVVGLNDLQSCMAFRNFRCLQLDFPCNVGLTDSGLLTLASAWPHLELLLINEDWGWKKPGITPNGLLQLLEMCRSLRRVALAFDVRGYTEFIPSPEGGVRFPPEHICVNVLDSAIEPACVPAVAAFFASIVPRNSDLTFAYWGCEYWSDHPECVHLDRWGEVHKLVTAMLAQHSMIRSCQSET